MLGLAPIEIFLTFQFALRANSSRIYDFMDARIASRTARSNTRNPPEASAPIANSSWPGNPNLRTTKTSRGASEHLGYLEPDGHTTAR